MARAPFQVLVYPYRQSAVGYFEYALFKRSDEGWWQAIAGGGEGDETPLETARRETLEESGIPIDSAFMKLDTVAAVPVIAFRDSYLWGDDLYVIPQYCFGVLSGDREIVLSNEHGEYRWLSFADAQELVRYDADKTALWELDRRLTGKGPRD
jgi:dATP pyrophosphohydrolase